MRPHAPFASRLLFGFFLLFGWSVHATNHILRQDEVLVGLNGDPNVQFLQITVSDGTQKSWGPGFGESTSRAMLVFFNGAGVQTGQFFFPNNAPIGQNTVLIATTNFANLPGAPTPDFIMPPLLSPGSGKVCFRGNPANRNAFGVNLCLSYGNFPANQTEGGGPPAPALPLTGEPMSLTRVSNFGFNGGTLNSDFALASPTPLNTAGQTIVFTIPGPEIETIPSALNFGPQNMNAGPTALFSVIITNRGVVNPLSISNTSLVGPNANQFSIVFQQNDNGLLNGTTRTLTLNFDPSSPGLKTAALRIVSNDENENNLDVPLLGIGVDPNAPEINVSPASTDFGLQNVTNGATASTTFTIANQGLIGALFVTNISLFGVDANQFQLIGATNASNLAPESTRTISVAFDPTTGGPKAVALRIVSSDTDEGVADIPLQGRGVDLNPCTAPNPTNTVAQDVAANALLVCPNFVFTGTTLGATADGASTCGNPGLPDVWFRYVPAANGTAIVSVAGIAFTPTVSVHRGFPGTVANQLACGTGLTNQSLNAQITFSVTNGVGVFVRVAGNSAQNSSFQLTLSGPACFDFDHNRNSVTDSCEFDFGDAPALYPTTLAANGARHGAFTGAHLGELADSNDDGLPTAFATGDNEDGPTGNDEDGVVFTTPLVVGQAVNLLVRASRTGVLNAWLDFNADRDWADANEQIFTNVTLQSGVNALALNVPNAAAITNLTFARFRFSTSGGLTFTGAALDGEVEDYALEILSPSPTPGGLSVRINEVMAGLNGDSTIQFVELEANGAANKLWGPQGGETAGRAMLVFFDQAGRQAGRFVFPSNAPAGNDTVLIATRAFADATGLDPDFIMPSVIFPIAGKVAFKNNPDNSHFNINIALSYGANGYYGTTDGAGTANTNPLPLLRSKSLTRTGSVSFGLNQNSAFQLAAPMPRNTAGQTATLNEIAFAEQGRALFFRETFRGNGRTCATCHVPGRDQFGLTPSTIAQLDEDDPLFVFEKKLSRLKLNAPSQPGDLRGRVMATARTAEIFSGSGDTYLITGVTNFSGFVADTNGNIGTVQSFTLGDLNGPTASNGSEHGLENHDFLEHGRGLILENIDGFKRGEVFRASPHLLNLALTGPFGLSGEFDSLDDFSDGAVVQHFPTSLARVRGVDFRSPTREELQAMSEFMFGISNPATNQISVDRLATTEAQKRGRTIFFGDQGRCAKCHSGPAFNLSDGSLPGSITGRNDNFNTGVANSMQNFFDNMPTEPAGLPNGQSTRNFNTPSLMNIRLTAPFFHDGTAATLKDAIKFYDSEEFHNSPAGNDVGSLLGANKSDLVDDLVAFLESLVELPVEFTRVVSFGIHCPGGPLAGPVIATITNISTNTITITNVVIAGTNAADFSIVSDTGQTNLAPGQTRSFQIAFAPAALGVKKATLEITALDTNLLGRFDFGVALDGADVDNVVQSTLTSFDFGTRDIDAPPSPEESIVISNDGSTDLEIAIEFLGPNAADFTLVTETNAIPAHGSRVMQVTFAPQTQGAKSALVRVRMISCTGTNIDIALAGLGTSTVHHFAWNPIGTNVFVNTSFPVGITARDRNNELVPSFHGTVKLMTLLGTQTNVIQITPTNSAPFASANWTGAVTVLQPAGGLRLLARDNTGHTGLSELFNAPLRDDLSLSVTDSSDPVLNGAPITYVLTLSNTGPSAATGIIVTNRFSPGVSFVSAVASQGTVVVNGGEVVADLGALTAAATATVTIIGEPLPGFSFVTNVASAVRNELEAVLANNRATNTTLVGNFGLLVVMPPSNFVSSGFSGGPFAPTNQIYTLSNAGTASLSWEAQGSARCTLPQSLAGSWALDGNALDSVSTNSGVLLGGPVFTNGFVGAALFFDGVDDAVRIAAAPAMNVGTSNGMTIELWINPVDVASQRPLVEWSINGSILGAHLWTSVAQQGGGAGSLWINLIDVSGINHELSSSPGFIQSNTWQHVAMTYSRTTGVATLYRNGVVIQQQNLGSFIPRTTGDLFLGRRNPLSYAGVMDEGGIYNQALSTAEIQAIFAAGAVGKCRTASPLTNNCSAPSGVASWWPFDGALNDVSGTNTGTLIGTPVFTNGFIGQALLFKGGTDGFRAPQTNALNIGTNDGMTFEAWFNVPDTRRNPVFEWDTTSSFSGPFLFLSANVPGQLFANLVAPGDIEHIFATGPGVFTANVWHHVAVTYNRLNGTGTIYLDGAVVLQQNIGIFTPRTTGNLSIGRRGAPGFEESFVGMIDEPAVYGRALTLSEIQGIFQAGSSGKCRERSWFSFSPSGGSLAAGAVTNVNVAINTNAQPLKIGSHLDRLTFTNFSGGRGTTERIVQLNVLNRRPTLASLSPVTFAEDSGSHLVNFSGVTAGSNETQVLTVTAISSDPALIANPIAVNYTSPAANGLFTFTTLTNAHGTATVSVVVFDSGSSFGGGFDAVTNDFLVTVTPVNDRPVLASLPNQTVDEGVFLAIANEASDVDLPGDLLTFSLPTAPTNAVIDPFTGVITWTPSELQGGITHPFTVVVADSGVPSLRATNQFTISVLKINSPPMLPALGDQTVHHGTPILMLAAATDTDMPTNSISYALEAGFPAGASINASNGVFTWLAGGPVPATNSITILAIDNGIPPLLDSKTFHIIVVERPRIESIEVAGTNVLMRWMAIPGARYGVQFKPDLQTTNWLELPGEITATNAAAGKVDVRQPTQRFYQIRVVP